MNDRKSDQQISFVAPQPSPMPLGGFLGRPTPGFAKPTPGIGFGTPGLPGPPLPPQPLGPEQPWPDKPKRLPFKPFTPTRAPFGKRVPLPFVGPRPGIPFPWLRFAGYLGLAFEAGWYAGELYQWYKQTPTKWDVPGGWIDHYGPCVGGNHNGLRWGRLSGSTIPSFMKCVANQPPVPYSPGDNIMAIGPETNSGTPLARMRLSEIWMWPLASPPAEVPQIPLPLPVPIIHVPPYYDPMQLPIFQPVPIFKPRPLKEPPAHWRPWGDPTPSYPEAPPIYWPAPPVPYPGPSRIPVRKKYPGNAGPNWLPSIDIPVKPGPVRPPVKPGPVTPGPVDPPKPPPLIGEWGKHYKAPPSPRVRERKIRSVGGRLAGLLWGIANGVTESTDVIDALYDALPWQIRRFKGRDGKWRDKAIAPQDRVPVIGRFIANASDQEFAKFMGLAAGNIAFNQVQDFAIGKLDGGRVKAYLKNAGLYEPVKPTGVSLSTGGAL